MENRTILTIENNIMMIPVVLATLRNIAEIVRIDKNEITQMEVATEEAVSNVIQHGFQEGEKAYFQIVFDTDTLGIKITIKSKGMPFDPTRIHEYTRNTLEKDLLSRGLGTYLMKQCMDEVSYHNLGQEGFETRLYKYLDNRAIQDQMSEEERREMQQEQEKEALPPGSIQYTVRRMKPDEAIGVSRCAYSAYGYDYYHDDVYYPDRVRELNSQEKMLSYVAVSDEGEIIAHCALERPQLENIPELGMAFTQPRYRGQGCLNSFNIIIMEDSVKWGFHGLYVQCVTAHPFSQKAILKYNFRNTAILLSTLMERTYKGIELKKIQRESFAIMYYYLIKPERHIIYTPEQHREILRKIYDHLEVKPEFVLPVKGLQLPEEPTIISTTGDSKTLTAIIKIEKYGKDVMEVLYRNLRGACILKNETVYLFLKLDDPITAIMTKEFETMGFFFAGILPGENGSDQLILQYLNNHTIDYDLLQVASETGKEILEYIRSQDPGLRL
ncbi:MAG: ATP-binding protein [Bacteroidetes bacterium]|nr:ATP-binding protein [Bacteroidota bacterium]